MKVKRVVSWSPEDDDPETCGFEKTDRNRARGLLGGLEGLGTVPSPDVFPPRNEEGRGMSEDDLRSAVGHRIANRLCSGDWHDREFLEVARAWVQSVQDECYKRDEEWWAKMIAQPHAGLIAANNKANGDRINEVIEAIDTMLALVSEVEVQ